MQDPASELRRIPLLRTWVNKGIKERAGPLYGTNEREASLGARGVPQGYGEGEEVALTVALTVALCSVGVVLWRVVAGSVLSLGPARSVLSKVVVVAEGTVRSSGSGGAVLEE
jgi:hypothetical protein